MGIRWQPNPFAPDFSDKPSDSSPRPLRNNSGGILDGTPIVDGFREGLDEFKGIFHPITYIKRRIGFVSGICAVIAIGSLAWWTFVEDPGRVSQAEITDPSSIAKLAASRGTRPVTNRVFGVFGWIGDRFSDSTPEEDPGLSPTQRVPNAYAADNDDEQQ